MLEALAILATLAYFDMSLVLLHLAGVLSLSKPVAVVLAGLFFVAGPGSWAAVAAAKPRPLTLVRLLAPLGLVAVVYASLLSSLVDSPRVHPMIRTLVLPAALAIAAIGLLEIAAREELRDVLARFYERGTGGLPPYTTLVLMSLSLLYASLAEGRAMLAPLVIYATGLALYARCARVTKASTHIATGVGVALATLTLALLARLPLLAALVASLVASVPHVAPLLRRGRLQEESGFCILYPVVALALAISASSLLEGYAPTIPDLLSNMVLYGVTGLIGWGSIVLVALLVRSSVIVSRLVESEEVRIASGLALTLIAAEALGAHNSMLVAAVLLAGFTIATLNNFVATPRGRGGG